MANEFKVKKGLIVDGSNTVLDIQGTQGQLFSVTDSLTGDLFSVSDVSGIPIFNVNSSGIIEIDGSTTLTGTLSSKEISIKQQDDSGFDAGLTIERSANTQKVHIGMDGGAVNFNSPDGLSYKFRNNGTEKFTVDGSGNATFAGAITTTGTLTVNSGHVNLDAGMSLSWDNTHERIEQSDGHLEFFINNGEAMTLDTDGLGIGTTDPTSRLSLSGQQSLLDLTRATSGDAKFFVSADSARLYFSHTDIQSTNLILKLDASDESATFAGNIQANGGLKVVGPASHNTIRSANNYTLGLDDSNGVSQWWFKAYTNGSFAIHENGVNDKFTIAAGGNATFTGDVTLESSTSTKPFLTVKNTNADANAPQLRLIKDSASPADNDETGRIYMYGDNDAGEQIETFLARTIFTDVSDGSEDSKFEILTYKAGTQTSTLSLESGDATFGGDVTVDNKLNFTGTSYQISGGSSVGDMRFVAPRFRFYEDSISGTAKLEIDGGNATFAGNVTLNSRLTFDYGGDHYFEAGTNTLAYKSSGGTSIMSLNASTSAATFAGNISIATTSTPRYQLDLAKLNNASQTDYLALGVNNGPGTGNGTALGTGIVWKANYSGYSKRSAGIMQVAEGNYFRSGLAFYTNNATSTSSDWIQRMDLNMDGKLTLDGSDANVGTVLDVQGTAGQLFSVTNSLTGDLFSVSDVSGIPIFNVNSSGLSTFDGDIKTDGAVENNGITTYNTPAGGVAFNLDAAADNYGTFRLRTNANANKWDVGMKNDNDFYIYNQATSAQAFEIDTANNIATFSATTKSTRFTSTTTSGLHFSNYTGSHGWQIGSDSTAAGMYIYYENGTYAMKLTSGGNATFAGSGTFQNASGNTLTLKKGTGTAAIAFAGTATDPQASALIEGVAGGGFKIYTSNGGTIGTPGWSPKFTIAAAGNSTFAGTISAVGASTFTLNDGIFIKAINGTNNVAATNVWGYGLYEGASKLGEISLVRDGTASQMYIGTTGANQVLRIGSANKVTALTIDASQNATFAGSVTAAGDVVAYSDKKLKKNIKTLDGSKVYDMRGVGFTRKDNGNESSGVIAQEIQKIAPELISETDGTLGVAYGNLTGYLIEAVKELKTEIEELKKQINNG